MNTSARLGTDSPAVVTTAVTLAIGTGGGAVFALFGPPLPWLLGALCFTAAASVTRIRLGLDLRLRAVAMVVLGTMIGSALSPELLGRVATWFVSMTGMLVFLAITVPVGIQYARRVMRMDPVTAIFAGMPGGLSEMVLTGASVGADPRAIGLTHTARLAIILATVPWGIELLADVEIAGFGTRSPVASGVGAGDLTLLLGCAVLGPIVGRILHLPIPFLLGSLLLSAIVHVAGYTDARPPDWLLSAVQVFIGSYVGAQFRGADRQTLFRIVGYSVGLTLILLGIAALFGGVLAKITGLSFFVLFLAFVPGGIAEMALIALILDVDPVFVATHHTLRILIIPPVARAISRRRD